MSDTPESGDWYCQNCGYLSSSRVTNSETCDTCHNPVQWHPAEPQDSVVISRECALVCQVLLGLARAEQVGDCDGAYYDEIESALQQEQSE